jgi:hypothetical protein
MQILDSSNLNESWEVWLARPVLGTFVKSLCYVYA